MERTLSFLKISLFLITSLFFLNSCDEQDDLILVEKSYDEKILSFEDLTRFSNNLNNTNAKRKVKSNQLQDEIVKPLIENGKILQQHMLINGDYIDEKEKREIQNLIDNELANLAFFSAVIKLQREEFYNSEKKKVGENLLLKRMDGEEFYETKTFRCVMTGLGIEGAAFAYAKSLISLGKFAPASATVFTMADGIALARALGKRAFLAAGLAWAIYEFTDCMVGE